MLGHASAENLPYLFGSASDIVAYLFCVFIQFPLYVIIHLFFRQPHGFLHFHECFNFRPEFFIQTAVFNAAVNDVGKRRNYERTGGYRKIYRRAAPLKDFRINAAAFLLVFPRMPAVAGKVIFPAKLIIKTCKFPFIKGIL